MFDLLSRCLHYTVAGGYSAAIPRRAPIPGARQVSVGAVTRPAIGSTLWNGPEVIRNRSVPFGAVIVYDANTLEEVERLLIHQPSGKYNVWNKITFANGASH